VNGLSLRRARAMSAAHAVLAALVLGVACCTPPALAQCAPTDARCASDPCQASPDAAPCRDIGAGLGAAARVQAPEVQQAVQEVILPRSPQLNLPETGKAARRNVRRPANLPMPPGMLEAQLPASFDPRPLPPGVPPANVARELAPQVFAGAIAVTRELDHLRALNELRRSDPRLADSAWMRERIQSRAGEAFRQLQRVEQRSQAVLKLLPDEARYADLRDGLARTAQALKFVGSGVPVEGR
jgi:hypothetical protein